MATVTPVTPEELLVLPDGKLFELVDGELLEKNVSGLSSYVGGRLYRALSEFCDQGAGFVFPSDCGFQCFPEDPDRVRKPDVSFVAGDRIAADEIGRGWIRTRPDLVVEVVSPNDVASELHEELADYASAGVPVVWVVYPESATAVVHRPDGTGLTLPRPVELTGEGPLDGFHCTLADLLPTDKP